MLNTQAVLFLNCLKTFLAWQGVVCQFAGSSPVILVLYTVDYVRVDTNQTLLVQSGIFIIISTACIL
jgi:hypothetical protein